MPYESPLAYSMYLFNLRIANHILIKIVIYEVIILIICTNRMMMYNLLSYHISVRFSRLPLLSISDCMGFIASCTSGIWYWVSFESGCFDFMNGMSFSSNVGLDLLLGGPNRNPFLKPPKLFDSFFFGDDFLSLLVG